MKLPLVWKEMTEFIKIGSVRQAQQINCDIDNRIQEKYIFTNDTLLMLVWMKWKGELFCAPIQCLCHLECFICWPVIISYFSDSCTTLHIFAWEGNHIISVHSSLTRMTHVHLDACKRSGKYRKLMG